MESPSTSEASEASEASEVFERQCPSFFTWLEQLPTRVEPGELRQLALGLVYFRGLSESFTERLAGLELETREPERVAIGQGREAIWVPPLARWVRLQEAAARPTGNLGRAVDAAIITFERDNPTFHGFLPRDYARPELGRKALARLIEGVSSVGQGEERPVLALARLCHGFHGFHGFQEAGLRPSRGGLAGRAVPTPRLDRVLARLGAQVDALERQLQAGRAFRLRQGRP